ncbi:hypothetical protein B0H12DRAFT_184730 [Mycena haematopus]|nr:hypothetical protein B0H12DRAFT_184730 [Mycena haematopus]
MWPGKLGLGTVLRLYFRIRIDRDLFLLSYSHNCKTISLHSHASNPLYKRHSYTRYLALILTLPWTSSSPSHPHSHLQRSKMSMNYRRSMRTAARAPAGAASSHESTDMPNAMIAALYSLLRIAVQSINCATINYSAPPKSLGWNWRQHGFRWGFTRSGVVHYFSYIRLLHLYFHAPTPRRRKMEHLNSGSHSTCGLRKS